MCPVTLNLFFCHYTYALFCLYPLFVIEINLIKLSCRQPFKAAGRIDPVQVRGGRYDPATTPISPSCIMGEMPTIAYGEHPQPALFPMSAGESSCCQSSPLLNTTEVQCPQARSNGTEVPIQLMGHKLPTSV